MGGGSSLKLLTAVPGILSLTSSQLLTFTQTLPTLVRYILCQWEHVECKSGGISLTILNLKLCLSPNTEKREGSRMTYWLPSVVMVMRVFSANKKDPLVSQEDTSPPPPTNPNPHKTKTAFNQTIVF